MSSTYRSEFCVLSRSWSHIQICNHKIVSRKIQKCKNSCTNIIIFIIIYTHCCYTFVFALGQCCHRGMGTDPERTEHIIFAMCMILLAIPGFYPQEQFFPSNDNIEISVITILKWILFPCLCIKCISESVFLCHSHRRKPWATLLMITNAPNVTKNVCYTNFTHLRASIFVIQGAHFLPCYIVPIATRGMKSPQKRTPTWNGGKSKVYNITASS
jgi:hypothetical protein